MPRTAVIAGVGPGLGASLARRFASEGCQVGLFARSSGVIEELADELESTPGAGLAVPTDVADPAAVRAGFERVRAAFGPVDVLVNHAASAVWSGIRDITPAEFERALRVGALGGLYCSQAALPDMDDGGTIIFTGATSALRGREGAVGFSAAKFAVRGMAESMARELGPDGIHVAHVVIDGQILIPSMDRGERGEEEFLDPDAIADAYLHLVEQDRSAWTLELDLRPHVESF